MIHLMSEKRDWGTAFSNSLLIAIYDLAWRSRNHPTTNHKITINTIPFEKIVYKIENVLILKPLLRWCAI